MQDWWYSMDVFQKTLWIIALFSSLVFVVQSIMTFVGMDSDLSADIDGADVQGGTFQLYTFRNFINFFLGFSWTAITLMPKLESTSLVLLISVVVGALLVLAVMGIFRWMMSMEQSGNIGIEQTIGCKGSVYLTIPASETGIGKVQITVRGAIREYDAMTKGDKLENGKPIHVTEVLNENTLLVTEA